MERKSTTALVTGAGARDGIGFATARLLARSGLEVAITSSSERIFARQAELANDGLSVRAAIADLTDPVQVVALRSTVGAVDVLVNNAGMGSVNKPAVSRRFLDMDEHQWDLGLAASLKTAFLVTRTFLPDMERKRHGRVIFMSSVTGPFVSFEGEAAYAAAKAGIVGLTHTLALEVGRCGVTVNAVAPGWIETGASTPAERTAALHTPLGRAGTADEVAAAVGFLASDLASYVNGTVLVVDGGNMLQERKG